MENVSEKTVTEKTGKDASNQNANNQTDRIELSGDSVSLKIFAQKIEGLTELNMSAKQTYYETAVRFGGSSEAMNAGIIDVRIVVHSEEYSEADIIIWKTRSAFEADQVKPTLKEKRSES